MISPMPTPNSLTTAFPDQLSSTKAKQKQSLAMNRTSGVFSSVADRKRLLETAPRLPSVLENASDAEDENAHGRFPRYRLRIRPSNPAVRTTLPITSTASCEFRTPTTTTCPPYSADDEPQLVQRVDAPSRELMYPFPSRLALPEDLDRSFRCVLKPKRMKTEATVVTTASEGNERS